MVLGGLLFLTVAAGVCIIATKLIFLSVEVVQPKGEARGKRTNEEASGAGTKEMDKSVDTPEDVEFRDFEKGWYGVSAKEEDV